MEYNKIEKGSVLMVCIEDKNRSVKVLEADAQRDYTANRRWHINLTCWCAEIDELVSVQYDETQADWLNLLDKHYNGPTTSSPLCVELGIGYPLHRDEYDNARKNGWVKVKEITTFDDIVIMHNETKKRWWQRLFC